MTSDIPAIAQLPAEAKRALLAMLARELMTDRRGFVSVTDASGEMIVYAIPTKPKETAEQALREADPKYLAELRRRTTSISNSMSLEEAIELQPPQEESAQ